MRLRFRPLLLVDRFPALRQRRGRGNGAASNGPAERTSAQANPVVAPEEKPREGQSCGLLGRENLARVRGSRCSPVQWRNNDVAGLKFRAANPKNGWKLIRS